MYLVSEYCDKMFWDRLSLLYILVDCNLCLLQLLKSCKIGTYVLHIGVGRFRILGGGGARFRIFGGGGGGG